MSERRALFVACLCAEWCGSCREYRPAFEGLGARFPDIEFAWVDIEDEPDTAGEIDVENFPTLVVQYRERVLFCGPMLPHVTQLERLIQTFLSMDDQSAEAFVAATAERRSWQGVADVRARMRR